MRKYFSLQSNSASTSVIKPIQTMNIEHIKLSINKNSFFSELIGMIDYTKVNKTNHNDGFAIPYEEPRKLTLSNNLTIAHSKFMEFVYNLLYNNHAQDLNLQHKNESIVSTTSIKSLHDDKTVKAIFSASTADRAFGILILYIFQIQNGISIQDLKDILQQGKKCCKFCLLRRDIIDYVNWCLNCNESFCR